MHLLARLSTPIRGMLAACGIAAALASPAAAQGGLLFDGSLLPNFGRLRNVVSKHLTIPVQGVSASGLRDSYLEGRSGGRTHHAIDIHAPLNTPVLAVTDGTILKLHRSGLGGNTIYHLDDDGSTRYYYAHLDHYAEGLHEGQRVSKGDVIGYVGDTGNAQPGDYHLHFAVGFLSNLHRWWDARTLDPYYLLRDGIARLDGDGSASEEGATPVAPVRLASVAVLRPRREPAATRALTRAEREAAFAKLEREERAALHRCSEVTGRTRARCREAVGDRFTTARARVSSLRTEAGTGRTCTAETPRRASSSRAHGSRTAGRKKTSSSIGSCAPAREESSASRRGGERSRRESSDREERSSTRRTGKSAESSRSSERESSRSTSRRSRTSRESTRSSREGSSARSSKSRERESSTTRHRETASRSERSTSSKRSGARSEERSSSRHGTSSASKRSGSSERSTSRSRSSSRERASTSARRTSSTRESSASHSRAKSGEHRSTTARHKSE